MTARGASTPRRGHLLAAGVALLMVSGELAGAPAAEPPLMDLALRREAARLQDGNLRAESIRPEHSSRSPRLEVFLLGHPDRDSLRNLGIDAGTSAGSVTTARIPVSTLSRLDEIPGLEGIVLARSLRPHLDASVDSVRAGTLREVDGEGLWSGLTGQNVVVGIVDSGLDPTHEDFQRSDGTSRIVAYWDQSDSTGTPPEAAGGGTLYDYGSEWSPVELPGPSRLWDPEGHGTHVAGIAVGDGSASRVDSLRYRFAGLAPQADIVAVAVDRLLETGVLDAVQYVFTRAAELGRPAVVNLSLGSQFGPHDGSTPLELGLDALTGAGRLVVAAAGNEGEDRVHAELHIPAGGSDSASVFLGPPAGQTGFLFFAVDAFYQAPDAFDVTVVTPAGRRLGPVAPNQILPDTVTAEGTVFLGQAAYPSSPMNQEVELDVSNYDPDPQDGIPAVAPASGEWRLVFRDRNGTPGGGEVDLWMALASVRDAVGNEPFWLRGYDPSEEIASPGSARTLLTVGSFNTKECWPDSTGTMLCTSVSPESLAAPGRITFFSSRGPTRDDREKPEVSAPGFVIASSRSHDLAPEFATAYRIDRTLQPDGEHFVFTGTSASAPHLSGALALALEREPSLTPEAARERLRTTSRKDDYTGPAAWSASAGYGKLDAGALAGEPVPVRLRDLRIVTGSDGLPRLDWTAIDGDPVVSFRLTSRGPDLPWEQRGSFPGPGPHGYRETRPGPAWEYRLWASLREGGEEPWATATWVQALPLRVGRPSPNPFRETCRLRVSGGSPSVDASIRARVFDVRGGMVRQLVAARPEGVGTIDWDGRDEQGAVVAPGVYWVRVEAAGAVTGARVVKIR